MVGFQIRLAIYRFRLWQKRRPKAKSFTMPKITKAQAHSTAAVTIASAAISVSAISSRIAAIGATIAAPQLFIASGVLGLLCGAIWLATPMSHKPLTREDLTDITDIVLSAKINPVGKQADLMEIAYETILNRTYFPTEDVRSVAEPDDFPVDPDDMDRVLGTAKDDTKWETSKSDPWSSRTKWKSTQRYSAPDEFEDDDDELISSITDGATDEWLTKATRTNLEREYAKPKKSMEEVFAAVSKLGS